MHEPINEIDGLLDFIVVLLRQFSGGPGPLENNLVRFGLPSILWAALFFLAWGRQRHDDNKRERMLAWGFAIGFLREFFMFVHTVLRVANPEIHQSGAFYALEPMEHALAMIAAVVVAGSFIGYVGREERRARIYLLSGLGTAVVSYAISAPWWIAQAGVAELTFHQTWTAWVFHVAASVLILAGIGVLWRHRSWLARIVIVALSFFLLGEVIMLFNFATDRAYAPIICPIGNTFHILAIPLLGYVYLREQTNEKQAAEAQLEAYRGHLEDLVDERTRALSTTNEQLRAEIYERQHAETALERLSRDHALILDSAGEGIFGVDIDGNHTFVNRAAAELLGYGVSELIGQPSHPTWHHSWPDGSPYPESECPLHTGYKTGLVRSGDDQVFWRRDGTGFPVDYVSTPIYEQGRLKGAVVIFQDISDRKHAQAETLRRHIQLSMQNTIAAAISQSLDLDTVLNTALNAILSELDADCGCIFLSVDGELAHEPRALCVTADAESEPHCPGCALPCRALLSRASVLDEPVVVCPDPADARSGHRTLMGVPLTAKGRVVGALTLSAEGSTTLADDLQLLTVIGQQIGMSVENARLYRETQRWAEELAALHQASVNLSRSLELPEVYTLVAEEARRLLVCQAAAVLLWDPTKEEITRAFVHGLPTSEADWLLKTLPPAHKQRLCRLISAHEMLVVNNVDDAVSFTGAWRDRYDLQALLVLPLRGAGQPLGCIVLLNLGTPRVWRDDEVRLAESFGNLATLVIEKARLHRQAELAAALEERQRIAADVHDGLAQTLSYMGHQVDSLMQAAGENRAQSITATAGEIRSAIDQASRDMRHLIASLQSKPEPPRSLQQLLQAAAAAVPLDANLRVTFESDLQSAVHLSHDQAEQVLRVVQEALNNVQRHAGATEVVLGLDARNSDLLLSITDNGCGFDVSQPAADIHEHFGLSIMRARAIRISGHLDISTSPGKGTVVTLRWPSPIRGEMVHS